MYLEGCKGTTKIIKKTTIFLQQKKVPELQQKKVFLPQEKVPGLQQNKVQQKKVFLPQKKVFLQQKKVFAKKNKRRRRV